MAVSATNRPANGESLKQAGLQSAKSAKTIVIVATVALLVSACGRWQDSASRQSTSNRSTHASADAMKSVQIFLAQNRLTKLAAFKSTHRVTSGAYDGCASRSYQHLIDHSVLPSRMRDKSDRIDPLSSINRRDFARNKGVLVDGQAERGFWSNIEVAPGQYNWASIDKWVLANRHRPIVWMIYGTPEFYQQYPGEASRWPAWRGIASPPSRAGHVALQHFSQAVKARYGEQIVAFEVWNEATFPPTGSSTSYRVRWPAARQSSVAPFFSGSASDLANIAYTLDNAHLGVPILAGDFADSWSAGVSEMRLLNAPVTLPGATGQGKNSLQPRCFRLVQQMLRAWHG